MFPLYDTVRSRRPALINWLLIALNGLIFIYEISLGADGLYRFIHDWGLVPATLSLDSAVTWLPLLTSMFLHGGWIHILGNMWTLLIFGNNVEGRLGHGRYLIFYLLCGVAAASAQIYFASASATPMIGASGAIAGVLGAYLILFPHARIASLVPIFFIFTLVELPAVVFLGLWFVMQLFSGWLALQGAVTNNVAWWAHVGGFAFGLITVHLFAGRR
ncbi:MAG TPA: rhomboid family intramembrane serine protease [Anaerolineales bacterium]|nr:rhomboid family intramembrane serine protease [Anaerolineales bacterium]HNB35963.1 rhomboid family intramembrane serine protease [Anaerolineales bacterium]HNC07628.1 rhomboid family intramembrane serine protease [Anaerolineales bacterium]